MVEHLLAKENVASSSLVSRFFSFLVYNFFMKKNRYLLIKYTLDLIFAIIALFFLLPLFLIVAIIIKIDSPGEVFFTQDRVGINGKNFKIYKFRTMVKNAPLIGPKLTEKNDFRITRVGKFLRISSIDELPQIFNIIKGEMSWIGPRPEIPSIVSTYNNEQKKVLTVRPGITGWAQVNGRDDLTIPEKLKLDIEYIEKISFFMDLKILLLTFPTLLSARGAN